MSSPENPNTPYEPKIPFEPEDFGLDVNDLDDVEEAAVTMAEGDMKLFVSEWALSALERQHNAKTISEDNFYDFRTSLYNDIARRRRELGLPERPGWHTS